MYLKFSITVCLTITCIRASSLFRKEFRWKCELYDEAWEAKTYTMQKGDFCSYGLHAPVWPSCQEKIFPIIAFSYPKNGIETERCVVKMELGSKNRQNIDCINKVVESINTMPVDKRKLVYTSHGFFEVSKLTKYNITFPGMLSQDKIDTWYKKQHSWIRDMRINKFERPLVLR